MLVRRCASLVVLVGLALFGLGGTASAELAAIRVGIANTSSDIGFFLADKRGYFRDEGLSVTLLPFDSAALMIAPLGSGDLDVGGGTVAAGLYNAVARGIDVKIVADKASIRPGYGFSTLLVRKDLVANGRYKTFKDLKGMTVATGGQGAGSESTLNEALKKGGLTFDDVHVVYLGYPQHLVAYDNKGIDASITNEPTVTLAVKQGVAVRVLGDDVVYPDQQTAVVLYSDDFMRHRRDIAEKFMTAYMRGIRDYVDVLKDGKIAGPGADAVIAVLTQYTKIKDPAIYREMTPNWVNPDGHVNRATLQNDFKFFEARGYIQNPKVGVDDVIDNSFVDAVLGKLGPYRPKSGN